MYQNMDYSFDTVGNVLGYTNDSKYYDTRQDYKYDDLYQLTQVDGTSISREYVSTNDYTATYSQSYTFDELGMGNMMNKNSNSIVTSNRTVGDELNYKLDYEYDENYAHRVSRIGSRYYQYDANGNVIRERDGSIENNEVLGSQTITQEAENVYGSEYGWAIENPDADDSGGGQAAYERRYTWNERNLLQKSSDDKTVQYRYGADGQRAIKSSGESETLYFNSMWSWLHTSAFNTNRESKNIYLGSTRLVTRLNGAGENGNVGTAKESTYYYHADHLGSAQLVTDYNGDEYERIEYTPYGETWIEHSEPSDFNLPYKFTGKELDEETGLYYYGARYLDPKTSRWLSVDPALGEYILGAGAGSEGLPGVGGIFNQVNFHVYHYAGNNPLKYVDPDGRDFIGFMKEVFSNPVLQTVGAAIGGDISIPDPSDVVPLKWAALGIALGATFVGVVIHTAVNTKSERNAETVLYHYSQSPTWSGSTLPPGSFLTDNPNMGSKEARSKLALPNIAPDQPLFIYDVQVSANEVTSGSIVEPMKNNITGKTLEGGGIDYITLVPLPMPPAGIPVGE